MEIRKDISTSTSCKYDGRVTANAFFAVWQDLQDVSNNTTLIRFNAWIDQRGIQWSGSSRPKAGIVNGWINDTIVFSEYFPLNKNGKDTQVWSSGERTIRVSHNSDGTKSVKIRLQLAQGVDNVGNTDVYLWAAGGDVNDTLALSTIPRATTPSCAKTCNAGGELEIKTPRAASTFKHKLEYWCGNKKGIIAEKVETSYKWTIPLDFQEEFPDAKSGDCTITCTTYNGDTKIGESKTCSVSINAVAKPTLSDISIQELNPRVSSIDTSITVQSISRKLVSAKASCYYSATVKSITVNGQSMSYSDEIYQLIIPNLQEGAYTITLTDSRGLTASYVAKQTFYAYSRPQITEAVLKRETETSSNGFLSVKANFSSILNNKATITLKRNDESSATSYAPTISENNISFEKQYDDLFYTASWNVEITITDKFGEKASIVARLGIGQYSLWMGKKNVKVGGSLKVNEGITAGADTDILGKVSASSFGFVGETSIVPHLIGSASYRDKAINSVSVSITGVMASHRFSSASIYDSNFVEVLSDSDGFSSIKILRKGLYLIPFKIQGSNVSGTSTVFYGFSLNKDVGSGEWGLDQYDQRTSLWACSFSTAFVKNLNEGDVIRWQVCGDLSRTVEGIEMWLIYLAE